MIDLALGLQTALFQTLSAAVTLAPVGQHIAEDSPLPYVVIAQGGVDDQGGKGSPFERHSPRIVTYFEGEGSKTVRQIQAQIRDALDGTTLTADGCRFDGLRWVNTDADGLLEDGVTYVGVMNFEVWAQPA